MQAPFDPLWPNLMLAERAFRYCEGLIAVTDLKCWRNPEALMPSSLSRLFSVDPNAQYLYFTGSTGNLMRSDLDGSNPITVLANASANADVEIDSSTKQLYYISGSSIKRVNWDGTNNTTLVMNASAQGIALDLTNNKIYWTTGLATLERASLDGTNRETIIPSQGSPGNTRSISVDPAHGKLYFTSDCCGLRWANLDGSNLQQFSASITANRGFTLDSANGLLYFKQSSGNLARSNLNGSGITTVITAAGDIADVELDLTDSKLF